eukprot:TRINITY_DN2122_c2_g5_i2.p1 TRINITY_DN2122_c2_g5~~TRINITY_DN2122_c2_g5_i2.p1  ORF type:complete len:242 (+),score=38.19 TRINITY_DN2122_c2_g5_i2:37-726(+)
MALNKTDTRQRAYNRIDSSSPQGNWVDEKSYNKSRSGCLMGNWWEEDVLRASVGETEQRSGGKRGQGGLESTKFLINPAADRPQDASHFMSLTKTDYNATTSDVKLLKPPRLGARTQRRVDEVLAAAKQMQEQQDHEEAAKTVYRTHASTYSEANRSTKVPQTTGPIDSFDYTEDQPITLYTGNPETGSRMAVQGNTCGTGRNTMARNCNFSTPITAHPIGGKHQTPQY